MRAKEGTRVERIEERGREKGEGNYRELEEK